MSQKQRPSHSLPARGVLAGIKADLQKAKQHGSAYDPRGVGTAWSHAFLNQKPWHPQNFRNQIKLYDAEQRSLAEEKSKQEALQEFEAEQEYLKTLSYLAPEEQQRYKERQSVSWMYQKPPGLEAALAAEKSNADIAPAGVEQDGRGSNNDGGPGGSKGAKQIEAGEGGAGAHGRGQGGGRQRELDEGKVEMARGMDKVREDPFAAMLTARMALEGHERFVLKHGTGGRSPVRGDVDPSAPNQQMLADGDDVDELLAAESDKARTEALLAGLSSKERKKVLRLVKKAEEEAKREAEVREAQRVLLAAGYDLNDIRRKDDKEKKKKRKKGHEGKEAEHESEREREGKKHKKKHKHGDH